MKYDVIIVGAGPAGIAAAKVLEKSNLSFCIIEKSKFPRFKLCGGGLTIKSQRALKKVSINIDNLSMVECTKVKIIAKNIEKELILTNKILMADRTEFDNNNFKQIKSDNVFEGETIINLENNLLVTDKNTYEFKYIIFADGVNGYSRRLIKDRKLGFCVECESEKKCDETILDFATHISGYGWIFPKKNSTTIGLGCMNEKKYDYINLLCDFAKKHDFEIDKNKIKGYHIPIFSKEVYQKTVINNKCILVGDAASLVDPISGEGIYYAIMSGAYAAESIIMSNKENKVLSEIYFDKTKNICASLEKRLNASKLLYSRLGNSLIKVGLSSDKMVNKLNRIFG